MSNYLGLLSIFDYVTMWFKRIFNSELDENYPIHSATRFYHLV